MSSKKEPLFRVVKRDNITKGKAIIIRSCALLLGLVIALVILMILFKANPFKVIAQLFVGCFGTESKIWRLLLDTALLLAVALALVPAFKMKFWNLGANGQILIGALVAVMFMHGLGGKVADVVIVPLMIVCAIAAGAIWALIPAIFKAFFNTNESLFTLMMNYVATGLVSFYLTIAVSSGSNSLGIVPYGHLPDLGNPYLLTILFAVVLLVFDYVYLRFSKHGYELNVVGESENTAKYIGINTKKVIIRTMALSGAICGVVGLLLAASINHSVSETAANNMGFTGIMVAWLAKFDPLTMVLTAFFITFLNRGMGQVQTAFNITNNSIADIIIGLFYFFIIGCEFFIRYKIVFRHKEVKEEK